MKINYTKDGSLGMTTDGWMITRTTAGWLVVDDEAVYVGRYASQVEAEIAATTRTPWTPQAVAR